MALLTFILAHYGGLAVLAWVSYVIGLGLTGRLTYRSRWEELSVCTTLGLGVLAYLVFALGLVGLLYPALVAGVVGVFVVLAYPVWGKRMRRLFTARRTPRVEVALAVVPAPLLLVAPILLPLYPAWHTDATMYHLPYAKLYVQHHQLIATPFLRYPVFPQVNEMLFTLVLLYADDAMTHLVQFLMMILVGVAIYAWGERLSSRRVGAWAAALWLGNPLVLPFAASAYIDIGFALFVTLALYTFGRWLETRQTAWLMLAGFFCGCAAGAKYHGLFFPLALGLPLVYLAFRQRRWTDLATFTVVAALVALPWYARNTYYTGNPLFPFHGHTLSEVLGYDVVEGDGQLQGRSAAVEPAADPGPTQATPGPASRAWNLVRGATLMAGELGSAFVFLLRQDLQAHLDLIRQSPSEAAPWARVIGYPLSPLYILILPFVLLWATRETVIKRWLVVVASYTVFWYCGPPDLRYLLPVTPLLCLATGAVLNRLWRRLVERTGWRNTSWITPLGVVLLLSVGWTYSAYKVNKEGPLPITQPERAAFLARRLPSYPAYKFLNELRGRDYTLYALYDASMAYFADGTFMGDWSGPASYDRIEQGLARGQTLYAALRTLGADYFLVRGDRQAVALPQDEFFDQHFRRVYSAGGIELFELVTAPGG